MVAQIIKLFFVKERNIMEKERNAGYQHFLLFPTMFSRASFSKAVKLKDFVVKD